MPDSISSPLYLFITLPELVVWRGFAAIVIGACVGSFLNVVALRSLAEKSWIHPRSYCPQCDKPLALVDLIPIISYLILRGQCRHCKKPISWQYPVVEAVTGLTFLIVLASFGITLHALAMLFFSSTLIAVTVTDFREKLIPHEITYPSMIIGILYRTFFYRDLFETSPAHARPEALTFSPEYFQDTLNMVGAHGDVFLNTLAGIGISYILFDFIDFYGLVALKFLREEEEEEQVEEQDPQLDGTFDIREPEYNEEDNIVMGGGDAVLAAVIAAWLGLQCMIGSVLLAFLVGSVLGASYLFVDMHRRNALNQCIRPAINGFLVGFGILCIPGFLFSMFKNFSDFNFLSYLPLPLFGGLCGALVAAIFSGSRFQHRFPFGPALAIGAFIVIYISSGGPSEIPWGIFIVGR